jgi:gluconolactonase
MSATAAEPFVVRSLELVAETDAHEGPVYVADEGALYFTSVRHGTHVALKRLELATGRVEVVREETNVANGMTLDAEGRLVICEQGTLRTPARITRLDRSTGELETVVDHYDGVPFNSPNDVVVASDGAVWFTDPSYGHLQGFRPQQLAPDAVYRHDPATGETSRVAERFDKPNGLAFSPDERLLYVSDNGAPHNLLAFEVVGDRLGSHVRVAIGTPGHPDGLKVDEAGRIYGSAANGVQVWDPDGRQVGEIELPDTVNFTFGGPGRDALFLTTDTAVWTAALNTKGA